MRSKIIDLLSQIEHELDFTEDEIEFTRREKILSTLKEIYKDMSKTIDISSVGSLLKTGARVVLFGPPNAGKSSLFNAILGYDRVLVSSRSGTTRDVVESWCEINGAPICLIDTAGYWSASDSLEKESIERTKLQIQVADLVLFVDQNDPMAQFKKIKISIPREKLFFIKSKGDLIVGNSKTADADSIISVLENTGLNSLVKKIYSHLFSSLPTNEKLNPVVASARQQHLLKRSFDILEQAITVVNNDIGFDVLASLLRGFTDVLSEVVGEISSDEVVNNIFSEFCVGK